TNRASLTSKAAYIQIAIPKDLHPRYSSIGKAIKLNLSTFPTIRSAVGDQSGGAGVRVNNDHHPARCAAGCAAMVDKEPTASIAASQFDKTATGMAGIAALVDEGALGCSSAEEEDLCGASVGDGALVSGGVVIKSNESAKCAE